MTPRHWYASRTAAERAGRSYHATGRRIAIYEPSPSGRYDVLRLRAPSGETVRVVDVTGRSARHTDRLARDWVGHGVSPASDGSRGVGTRFERMPAPVFWRWQSAEARAQRAVAR